MFNQKTMWQLSIYWNGLSKTVAYKKEKCQKLFPHHFVHDVAGMEKPYYYRNKVIVALIKNMNMVYMKKHLIALYR